jgi:hypothetical protein
MDNSAIRKFGISIAYSKIDNLLLEWSISELINIPRHCRTIERWSDPEVASDINPN